ncbi:MAG: hypothetical protein WB608_14175 [Terracidiphilus sp.]
MTTKSSLAKNLQGRVGGGLLIVIGLGSALKLMHLNLDWPSAALILIGGLFVFTPLTDLVTRIHKVKFKEMEVVLDDMVLPPKLRAELSGLSSHDIWALDSFANGIGVVVESMKPAQRVAARMLVDFRLLSVAGEGPDRKVSLTPQGQQLLAAAKSLAL